MFLVLTKKKNSNFSLLFFSVKGKNIAFPIHFSVILLGSAHLVGIILGVNPVCT